MKFVAWGEKVIPVSKEITRKSQLLALTYKIRIKA